MALGQNMHASDDAIIAGLPSNIELANIPQPQIPDKLDDPFLITFSAGHHNASNPKNWPTRRKWTVTDVLSATGFNRIMVSTIMAPALPLIARELSMSSTEAVMAMSIYVLATAFGPLIIGPLSEVYGRAPILHATGVWFLVWNIVCGFAKTKEVLVAARFLAGFGASSIFALAGGVLGDIWRPEQRGRSLGVYLMIPLLGAAVGPIVGGFMAGRTTWRWMFWATSIFQAVMVFVAFTAFRETYGPLLLKRRAEKMRQTTGDMRYYTAHERMEEQKSVFSILRSALSRPLQLLLFHPVIQIVSLIEGFHYGILYIVLSSFADLWTQHYHFRVELSGLHYIAIALGNVAGSQLGGRILDAFHRRMKPRDANEGASPESEHRIPLMFPGYIIGYLGLIFYGWTAQFQVHWIAVDIGVFFACFGTQVGGMAMQAYVIDAYVEHTSSATAATRFLESLSAFLFPLFAPSMYGAMGYGWGNTALAAVGIVIGFPMVFLLWKRGQAWRLGRGQ
ncbi:MFS general substrate transporter [Lentithecium fluviatile CBS 122367]|uniref:MFS general substrate transporter n=1 Tax=Lentithecium fluviatile CBS 122367 TaxID=1168545 RepID=A0A6G1IUI8_9PLEO|nr:MFS general substrate transporter [Lentithecium fluviatile CBS 122367]